jgi:hypothetical protein
MEARIVSWGRAGVAVKRAGFYSTHILDDRWLIT